MQILPVISSIKSLSSSYIQDKNITIRKHKLNNIEGFNFNSENYLLSSADSTINNYSALYLTGNNVLENFKFNELDRKIVFSSGIFLFTSSALNEYLKK